MHCSVVLDVHVIATWQHTSGNKIPARLQNVNIFTLLQKQCVHTQKKAKNKSHFGPAEQRRSCVYPQLPASLRPNHLQEYKNNGIGPKKEALEKEDTSYR